MVAYYRVRPLPDSAWEEEVGVVEVAAIAVVADVLDCYYYRYSKRVGREDVRYCCCCCCCL